MPEEGILNCSNITENSNEKICIENPQDMLKPWATNPMFIPIVTTYSIAFLIGLIGNSIVIYVFSTDRKVKSVTNLFLISLAISDLLLLCIYAPLETYQYFAVQWDETGIVCKVAKYVVFLSAMASILNLAAVSLERFIVIVFPLESRSLCTLSNCRRGVAFVWICAIILAIPVFFTKVTFGITFTDYTTNVTLYYCNDDEENGKRFAVYQIALLLAIPGLLMVFCYAFVIRELWQSTRNMALRNVNSGTGYRHSGQRSVTTDEDGLEMAPLGQRQQVITGDPRNARKQVIKMLILIIVLFFVCWGSRTVMEYILKAGLDSYSPWLYNLRVAVYVLPVIHSCVNPIIYSFMSKSFQRSLQSQVRRLCKCEQQSSVETLSRSRIRKNFTSNTFKYRKPATSNFSSTYNATETKNTEIEVVV